MDKKKLLKIIGNILTVISIIIIAGRLWKSGFDISVLFQPGMLLVFLILIIVQTAKISVSCFPWLQIVEVLTGAKLSFATVRKIYVTSNLYKYIPGNIFQYVGRNSLAVKEGISHVAVGLATLTDMGIMLFAALCTAIILMKDYAIRMIIEYGENLAKIAVICILALALLIIALLPKYKAVFKKKIVNFVSKITAKNALKILLCFLYYAVNNAIGCLMFIGMIRTLTGGTLEMDLYLKLAGAYILSFVIGFITPGASGGLGIREAAMLVLSGGLAGEDVIVLASIVMRIVGVLGDIFAYFAVQLGRFGRKSEN
jgi:hypothetical protein